MRDEGNPLGVEEPQGRTPGRTGLPGYDVNKAVAVGDKTVSWSINVQIYKLYRYVLTPEREVHHIYHSATYPARFLIDPYTRNRQITDIALLACTDVLTRPLLKNSV